MDPVGNSTGKYGGSVREAGGAWGSMGAAREEIYFRQVEQQQLEQIRHQMEEKQHSQPTTHQPSQSSSSNSEKPPN